MKKNYWKKGMAACLTALMAIGAAGMCVSAEETADAALTDALTPYEETVTIKVAYVLNSDMTYYGGEDAYNNTWIDAYKDYLNIELEVMWVVDQSQESTKLNAAIASGSYPDIIVCDPATYQTYATSGVIADVTEYYDYLLTEDAQTALAVDGGYAVEAATLDGSLYGIPILTTSTDSMECLFIRQDWLDNLGLEAPTTVEELEEVARAFTEDDPDGNGADDTFAFAFDGVDVYNWWGGMEAFFECYGAYPLTASSSTNFSLIEEDGTLVWGGESGEVKTALEALRRYYENGYISASFGTADYTEAISQISTGQAGMFFAPMYGVMTIATEVCTYQPDAVFTAVPLPGTEEGEYGKSYYVSSLDEIVAISSKCEHPEALFKMFCLGMSLVAYNDDAETFAMYNGDGENYNAWKLAAINPLKPFKNYDNYLKVSEAVKTGDTSGLDVEQQSYYDAAIYVLENELTEENLELYAANYGQWAVFADENGGYAAIAEAYESGAYQEAGYGAGATESMAAVSSTLEDLIKTSIIQIIYGEQDVEYWDTVISNWHTLGGDTVLEEANEWLASK